ncbi:unnamed protein product [Owenia fusiformis]|uniref:Uncharacterized protein n=1 Tax=Owenia fusiformis TaxID=6347 RepID=A0A8J1TVI4_OWEFU|nr:unnamed protein product [Owenia fusiformis]
MDEENFNESFSTTVDGNITTERLTLKTIFNFNTWEDFRILQPIWDLRIGYEYYLCSPLFPIVLSVSFYFLCVFPPTLVDLFGREWAWYQKYKIQNNKEVTWKHVRQAMMITIWNQIVYVLPAAMAQWIWVPPNPLPERAPTLFEYSWHVMACLLLFDFEFFVWHYIHHKVRFLYKVVHSVHHRFYSPFSLVTQYMHPWELFSLGIIQTTAPMVFQCHPMTSWGYMTGAIIVGVDAHVGFDFPGLPHRWAPFGWWGGAPKHDMHHRRPNTNFQPFFNHWDRLFGFDCPSVKAGNVRPKELHEYDLRKRISIRSKCKSS